MRDVKEYRLVEGEDALREVVAGLGAGDFVAIDTEFVRERTYYAELCLIQLATRDLVACIDCIEGPNLDALFDVLFGNDVTWLLHSARQDLEVLWTATQRLPARLIDTQIAAALAGHSPQIGLQELLGSRLGVTLDKGHTRADWSRRPLEAGAIDYALDDVRHLPALWADLERELADRGRAEWLREDARRVLETPLMPDTPFLFGRVKGAGSLRGRALRAALALVEWREGRARQANRPRRWILSDEALVEIARRQPASVRALDAVESLPPRAAGKSGRALVAAVAAADTDEMRSLAEAAAPRAEPDGAQLRHLRRRVRTRAEALGIQPEILATRRDLAAFVLGERPERLVSGWRAAELGLV